MSIEVLDGEALVTDNVIPVLEGSADLSGLDIVAGLMVEESVQRDRIAVSYLGNQPSSPGDGWQVEIGRPQREYGFWVVAQVVARRTEDLTQVALGELLYKVQKALENESGDPPFSLCGLTGVRTRTEKHDYDTGSVDLGLVVADG